MPWAIAAIHEPKEYQDFKVGETYVLRPDERNLHSVFMRVEKRESGGMRLFSSNLLHGHAGLVPLPEGPASMRAPPEEPRYPVTLKWEP